MAVTWGLMLGLMVIMFFIRPMSGDTIGVVKIILVMGMVGVALRLISVNLITDWATSAGKAVGATTIAASLVLVGVNFAIQGADIPFLPENIEKALRYVIYAVGGVLMVGSAQWGLLFTDMTGLLAGGTKTGGVLGMVLDAINLLILGLRNQ